MTAAHVHARPGVDLGAGARARPAQHRPHHRRPVQQPAAAGRNRSPDRRQAEPRAVRHAEPRAGVRAQQPRRHGAHRLQAARIRRHRARQADPRAAALRRRADRRDHRRRRPPDPLRRARGRRHRFPDQAARRARNPRPLRQSAGTAAAQDRAVRPGAGAAVPGRQVGRRDPRARAGNAVEAREGRRVPRQDDRQSPDADGQVLGADRPEPRPRRRDRAT